MFKEKRFSMVVGIILVMVIMASLYMAGYDLLTCTNTDKGTYSNGKETIELIDYQYTPVFHNKLLTVHKDTLFNNKLKTFYVYNINTGEEVNLINVMKVSIIIILILWIIKLKINLKGKFKIRKIKK